MKTPEIVTTVSDLRGRMSQWRKAGERVGLVPTMGALHEGHLSLVRETQKHCNRSVASIFVNPAQFAPHEDFDRYPRTLENDSRKLDNAGLDLIFAPSVAEMYPSGFATKIEVGGPSAGLETDFRPHFFAGVATVVAKLLIAALPDYAIFGEKDYQQLRSCPAAGADLGLPIEIVGAPIIREPDGLAMSSRNAYLSPEQRKIAPLLNQTIAEWRRIAQGRGCDDAEVAARFKLDAAGFRVDYVAVRDADTLQPLSGPVKRARILAAAKIGKTRLIDNVAMPSTATNR